MALATSDDADEGDDQRRNRKQEEAEGTRSHAVRLVYGLLGPHNGRLAFLNMTRYSHGVTNKMVRVAELKAKLSEHLRTVRRGARITVLDRDTPIAEIVPVERPGLVVTPPRDPRPIGAIALPPPLNLGIDVVALLREDRDRR